FSSWSRFTSRPGAIMENEGSGGDRAGRFAGYLADLASVLGDARRYKPQIALEQIKWACEAGLPRGVLIIDAGYGVEAKFRNEIGALKLKYVAGVKTTNTVWVPETLASPHAANARRGADESTPISIEKLALALPMNSWRTIRWRDGTNAVLSSRFAR